MNTNKMLDELLDREGPGDPATGYLAKHDAGGRTNWGISERSHPEEWLHGPPTKARAREVMLRTYIMPFFPLAVVGNDRLIECIIDDAVMSGVVAATKRLQWVVGTDMDGVVGLKTVEAVKVQNGNRLLQRYVVERIVRITRLVQQRPTDLTNLSGWCVRILAFLPDVN